MSGLLLFTNGSCLGVSGQRMVAKHSADRGSTHPQGCRNPLTIPYFLHCFARLPASRGLRQGMVRSRVAHLGSMEVRGPGMGPYACS